MSMKFALRGRGLQPVVQGAADLPALLDLDEALWVATAAPVKSFRADPVLLASLDTDGDGRIRSDELRAAIRWTLAHLSDTTGIDAKSTTVRVAAIPADAPDGPTLRTAAESVAPGAAEVTLEAIRKVRADEEATGLSAAGMAALTAAGDDEALASYLGHIVEVTGGVDHPVGGKAVTAGTLDQFLADSRAWLDWSDAGATDAVRTLGDGTAAAHAAVEAISAKMDQFFLLCDAVRLDAGLQSGTRVDPAGTDLLDVDATRALLAKAPLSPPDAAGVLQLDGAVNPAYTGALKALQHDAMAPVLGEDDRTLDHAGWDALKAKVAPFGAWLAAKPANGAGGRGADAVRAHLEAADLATKTRDLLAASEVRAKALAGVKSLERLALHQGGLLPFVRSFVTMPDLFATDARCLFEHGHLVMDGRVFDLAVRVLDAGRHEKFGARSPMFVMYVQVGEKGGTWTDELAVPVTAGNRGNLVEGMYGVFVDLEGKELHAHIRKIAVSPISIREAIFAPFRRIGDAIQAQADKAAASSQADMNSKVDAAATSATDKATTSATGALANPSSAGTTATAAGDAGKAAAADASARSSGMASQLPMLIAGGGVALAGLSAAFGLLLSTFMDAAGALAAALSGLPVFAQLGGGAQTAIQLASLPLAVVLLLTAVVLVPFLIYAIPVAIATWLRLRRRDLSALLEGAGWAVNTRQYISRDLARTITRTPLVSPANVRRG